MDHPLLSSINLIPINFIHYEITVIIINRVVAHSESARLILDWQAQLNRQFHCSTKYILKSFTTNVNYFQQPGVQ